MNLTSALCGDRANRRLVFLALAAAGMMALGLAAASLTAPASAYAYDQNPSGAIGTVGCPDGNHPRTYYVHSCKDANNCIADMVSSRNNPMQESKITIEVTTDWYTKYDGYLKIPSNIQATLNLNGHMINRGKARSFGSSSPWWGEGSCQVVYVDNDATLTVNGGSTELAKSIEHGGTLTDIHENGAAFWYPDANGATVIKGGLITGGACDDRYAGGGITVDPGATLYLNDVTLAGNLADKSGIAASTGCGGGICLDDSSLFMSNSRVVFNHANGSGGGVYSYKAGGRITLKGASEISYNCAGDSAGGIYTGSSIDLEGKSIIKGNHAGYNGGGVFCGDFAGDKIASEDGTGLIEENIAAKRGGGCYVGNSGGDALFENLTFRKNKAEKEGGFYSWGGVVSNVTFDGNQASGDHGGLNIAEGTVKNCTVKGNSAAGKGGGICTYKSTVESTTVTGNSAEYGGGILWEENATFKNVTVTENTATKNGGGVYCINTGYCTNSFLGKIMVDGNKLKDGTRNNLTLKGKQDLNSAEGDDQLNGESRIGVNVEGWDMSKRKIGGNRAFSAKFESRFDDVVYADDDKASIVLDEHLLYLVSSPKTCALSILGADGETVLRSKSCAPGDAVTVASADYPDASGAAPDYWLAEGIDGAQRIYPLGGYATFVMPANAVRLTAHYPAAVKKATLALDAPKAGEALPATARLSWGDAAGEGCDVAVAWSKVGADGTKAAAAGKAEAGASYAASVTAARACVPGALFDAGISAADVTVEAGDAGAQAASASVDAATGALTVETAAFKIEGEADEPAGTGTVTVELENGGLTAGVEASSPGISLMAAGDEGEGKGIGTAEVSYSADSGSVTIAAPACVGFNFCYWSDAPDGVDLDSEAGTATFDAGEVEGEGLKLGAVYSPVVTAVDLGLEAPAPGQKLGASLAMLEASCSDGSDVDLLEGFSGGDALTVSWGPEPASGKAAPYTGYTATVELDDDEGYVGVEAVMSPSVEVSCNGKPAEGAVASFEVEGGKLCANATFPADLKASASAADEAALKAVKGKTVAVKANKKSGKTKRAKSVKLPLAASQSGAAAKLEVLSKAKLVKVSAKSGKLTLKKGAKRGKAYKAKLRVSYGEHSKKIAVKFKVK